MKSMKRNVIVSAFLAIALCMSVVAGATFALFTSSAKVNLSITSATVKATADVENLKLYSTTEVNPATNKGTKKDLTGKTFLLGGTANFADGVLTLDRLAPGDGVTFDIKVTNKSNIDVKYRVVIGEATGSDLADALDITVNCDKYEGAINTEWNEVAANAEIPSIPVKVELPVAADNDYAEKTVSLDITVEVVQASIKNTESAKRFTKDTEYKLTGIKANGGNGVLRVTYGTLTINGVGTLKAVESSDHYAMAIWAKGANSKVIINGGKYVQEITGTDTQYDMIYASDKATIEIYGGTFQCATPQWTLNCQDNSGSKIYVMGGKFYKFNPADPHVQPEGTEEIIVPEGYEVKKSGDWYEVKPVANAVVKVEGKFDRYTTLEAAVKAADDNATIELLGDVKYVMPNTQKEVQDFRNITVNGNGNAITFVNAENSTVGGCINTIANIKLNDARVIDKTWYAAENGENAWEFTYLEVGGNSVFTNVYFEDGIMTTGACNLAFNNCTFVGHHNTSSEYGSVAMYGVWAYSGKATFDGCTFKGLRGLKIHHYYNDGDTLELVTLKNCKAELDENAEKGPIENNQGDEYLELIDCIGM